MNEDTLIKKCIITVAPADIPVVASSIPLRYLQRLVEAFADLLEKSPHLEFILQWCQVIYIFLHLLKRFDLSKYVQNIKRTREYNLLRLLHWNYYTLT